MNFGADDPLADLLSDNSLDNDSFFENPAGASKGTRLSGSTSKAKGKIDDLFGIQEETDVKSDAKATTNRPGRPATTSAPRITTQNLSQSNEDDDDLGFDPKKPRAGLVKGNIFDDLLGTEFRRPATAIPASRREETTKPAISRQSTDTTTENSTNLARPRTAGGRRSSGTSSVIKTDPLGLFEMAQTRDKDQNLISSGMSTPKTTKRSTTADWLGLNTDSDTRESKPSGLDERVESPRKIHQVKKPESPVGTPRRNAAEILKFPEAQASERVIAKEATVSAPVIRPVTPVSTGNTAQNIMQLNNVNMERANSYVALQQQESQLTFAMQMKRQEEALQDMQRKQLALLQHQEQQCESLLQQQIQRQNQLEEHINMQQQRINAHIQLLMSQPTLNTIPMADAAATLATPTADKQPVSISISDLSLEKVQLQSEVKRLDLEKQRLEELVTNLRTNYEREIDMIEESFGKQLKMAEERTLAIEKRLKYELEEQSQYYTQKLEALEAEKQKLKMDFETEVSTLRRVHEEEVKKLRRSQEEDFDMLKEEHRRMLENIRQSKLLEFAAVQDNGSYLDTLRAASNNLMDLSGGLTDLRDEMQLKMETLSKEREKKLECRERKVEDMERRLKIAEETASDEKQRLMDLVSGLELQLDKLSKESAEESWQLRQKMASLDAEKLAFEKEKEFGREQLARDEKRVAELKELQLAQTQQIMLEVQEERSKLVVERARIETERKLRPSGNVDKERLEVDAALKVAQDATRQADAERERYHKMQRQLEQQKRDFVEKENMLRAKEDELEQELNVFRLAERKSQEAQQKAHCAEQAFQEKIKYLQQRMREVGEKEANLAQERMLLAQDRIALHNLKAKVGDRKCTLCKMSERSEEISQLLQTNISGIGTGMGDNDDSGVGKSYRHMLVPGNLVDRLLDENIAESFRKMKSSTNVNVLDYWPESGLDDDSKELALHNLDSELNTGNINDYLGEGKTEKKK